jgi:hypothetical protein
MNSHSWIPTRASALPVQYLASLNQLSATPDFEQTKPSENRAADPMFLNRLQMPAAQVVGLPSEVVATTVKPQATATPAKADKSPGNLWESLRGLSPVALKLEQRATSFEFDAKEIADEKLQAQPESARQAMQQFVGETFYGMLMKQMRNTVVQSDLYGNSSAKNMFESQLDQTLVQELATNHSEFLSRPIRI